MIENVYNTVKIYQNKTNFLRPSLTYFLNTQYNPVLYPGTEFNKNKIKTWI